MNWAPTRAAARTPRSTSAAYGLIIARLIPPALSCSRIDYSPASVAAHRLAVAPHQFVVAALSFLIGPRRLVRGVVVAARADKGLEVTAVTAGERRGSGDGVR